MIEAIGQVQALVHEQLGLLDWVVTGKTVLADLLQARRAGAGFGRRVELIGGLIVFVDGTWACNGAVARPSTSAARHNGRWRIDDLPGLEN
jgi:hypothetical protein